MVQPLALITGATKGIGRQFAYLFAKDGYALALVARSRDDLDSLADELGAQYSVPIITMARDLTDPATAVSIQVALSTSEYPLSVVVNNAGYGLRGSVMGLSLDEQIGLIQTNVMAMFRMTRLLLPVLFERKGEGIINVASLAAWAPGPNMAVYHASKAFVLSFSEALCEELKHTGLKVTCLAPGPTATEFALRASMKETRLGRLGTLSAEFVAETGYRGFKAGQCVVIPGFKNQWLAFWSRFMPRVFLRKFLFWLQE